MCKLFLSQNPATFTSETRALRLHGHATSLRLEQAFWTILEEIAAREGMSLAHFVGTLYDEIVERLGAVPNFASFLRVTCLHYLRNQELHAAQLAAKPAERQENHEFIA